MPNSYSYIYYVNDWYYVNEEWIYYVNEPCASVIEFHLSCVEALESFCHQFCVNICLQEVVSEDCNLTHGNILFGRDYFLSWKESSSHNQFTTLGWFVAAVVEVELCCTKLAYACLSNLAIIKNICAIPLSFMSFTLQFCSSCS